MKKQLRLLLAIAFLTPLLLGSSPLAAGAKKTKKMGQEVYTQEKIPEYFSTYTLFLVCNPSWLSPNKSAELSRLFQDFMNFGRAIGDHNLALWFWKSRPVGSAIADNVDVERAVRICKAWKLTPSEGPHLVVTTVYPAEPIALGLPQESVVYKLGNMNPQEISSRLTKLTDQLVLGVRPSADETTPLWLQVLSAIQQALKNVGCAVTKVSAGIVTADLHTCNGG